MKKIGLVLLLILTSNIYSKPHNEYVLQPKTNKTIKLIEPPLEQRKGAIRGVPIRFRILSKQIDLEYELINPPKGMRILGHSDLGEWEIGKTDGVDVLWNVPMDIEEKTYAITMKATDFTRNEGTLSFDIKVPKTTIISTKIENNELIVTDKNSNLYGMKLKGHNGENISNLILRSVDYTDVWKKEVKNKSLQNTVERTVFIIDNMPEKLDLKFPEYIDNYQKRRNISLDFKKYTEAPFFGRYLWEKAYIAGYEYEGTKGLTIERNRFGIYGSNGSKVYILIFKK